MENTGGTQPAASGSVSDAGTTRKRIKTNKNPNPQPTQPKQPPAAQTQ